jgi:Uma2 family endonuclease
MVELFVRRLESRALVWAQCPILLDFRSEPQPDVTLVRPPRDAYRERLPSPADVLLIVEVSDASLGYGRRIRLPKYAAAGVPEVWIANIERQAIEVHRAPTAITGYTNVQPALRGDRSVPKRSPIWFSPSTRSSGRLTLGSKGSSAPSGRAHPG